MSGVAELILLVVVVLVAGSAAWAGWRAAPYVPTRGRDVKRLMTLAEVTAKDTVYDLGAGDGRIVIAAARRGATSVGFEISFLPWLITWLRIWFGRFDHAQIRFQDFYQADLRDATVVIAFLLPAAMKKLADKFLRELVPGTRVLSCGFQIPGWEPVAKDKPDPHHLAIWVYRVPDKH